MKRKGVSSSCRSKTGMGVYHQDLSGGAPTVALSSGGGLGGRNSGVAPLWAGGTATTSASRQRTKSHAGGPATPKDVKKEDRSGNVYENKGSPDNLPDRKHDICAWLNAILQESARMLRKPSALLSQFALGNESVNSKCEKSRPRTHRPVPLIPESDNLSIIKMCI